MKPKLPKVLLAAVLATFSAVGSTVVAADIISINFYKDANTVADKTFTEGVTSLNGVGASGWNDISGSSGTHTYEVTNQSGAAAGNLKLILPQGPWGDGVGSELDDVLAKSYLDLGASNQYTVSFDNNYFVQEVILYFSGDGDEFSSVNVNGISYVGGVDNPGTESWGDRASWTDGDHYYNQGALNAQKAIKVSHVFGALEVRNNITGDSSKRATLAGMQIIDHTGSVYSTALASGEHAAAKTSWTRGGTTVSYNDIAEEAPMLQVTAHADGSTLNLAGGDTIDMLAVMGNALTVTSEGAVKVNSLYTEQSATLNFNASLTDGSSVYISNHGTMNWNAIGGSISALVNTGTLNIKADTTVSGGFSHTGTLTVDAGKTLTIGSLEKNNGANPTFISLFKDAGTGNITINGNVGFIRESGNGADNPLTRYDQQTSELTVTGDLAVNAWGATEWRVGEGKTLTVGGNAAFQTKQTLVVNGGTVNIGGQLILGHEQSGNNPGHLRLEGGSLTVKSLYLRQGAGADTVDMTGGTLEFTDGAAASVITRDTQTTGDNPQPFEHLSSVTITGGTLQATKNSWTADLGAGGSAMAVSDVTIATENGHTITLGHANVSGTITNNGNLALTNATLANGTTITNTGNLTLGTVTNSGTATLNGNITLSGTITDNGSLDLTGAKVSILGMDGFTRDESAEVTYTGGQVNGNGFETSQYIIVAGSGSGNRGLSVSYEGSDQSLQDGKLGGKAYGTFYVNSGTESVSYISSAAPEGNNTSAISMANGTTLTVDAALGDKRINVNGAATADIGEKQSVNSSSVTVANGAALTLTGSGTYEVTTANAASVGSAASNTTHLKAGAGGWTGTVTLSNHDNATNHTQIFSNLVNGTHSKLELKGFAGWGADPTWHGTEATNFILTDIKTDTGSIEKVAWKNGAFSTQSTNTLKFTGEFSGEGTFQIDLSANQNAHMHYTFAGDISNWEGKILKSGHANPGNAEGSTLTFTESAKKVNVTIEKSGGALNVVAGVNGITFSKNITATSLAMNANVNATLQGTTTVDTLTLNAGATATLSGNGKVAAGGGKISFEALNNTAAPAIATLQEGDAGGTPAAATGTIENGGATEAVSFSSSAAGSADTTYTNIKAVANSTTEFELLGTLTGSAVVNEGTGAVTVTASGNQDGLYANNGNITAKVKEATITLRELSIAEGKAISATSTDTQSKATLVVSSSAIFGASDASNATLNANMVLESGVALTLGGALQMGSSALTLNEGIRLGGNLLAELQALPVGGKIDLFTGVDTLTLATAPSTPATYALGAGDISADISMADEVDLGTYFSNVGKGNYFLVYDSQTGTVSAVVPEPATATLGLLALAGLCARRRRR